MKFLRNFHYNIPSDCKRLSVKDFILCYRDASISDLFLTINIAAHITIVQMGFHALFSSISPSTEDLFCNKVRVPETLVFLETKSLRKAGVSSYAGFEPNPTQLGSVDVQLLLLTQIKALVHLLIYHFPTFRKSFFHG